MPFAKQIFNHYAYNFYTSCFKSFKFFEAKAFEFELVEAAHVCYMGDGDMFKMEDVGDEKVNSWNAMCIA
jgi:hypothetical protein